MTAGAASEIKGYLKQPCADMANKQDNWTDGSTITSLEDPAVKLSIFSSFAWQYLTISVSSASVEKVFSIDVKY